MPGGPAQPEITTLPFPDVEANSLESLLLPNLTQSVRGYICHAVIEYYAYCCTPTLVSTLFNQVFTSQSKIIESCPNISTPLQVSSSGK